MNAIGELNPRHRAYKKALCLYVWESYRQDVKGGDITTRLFVSRAGRTVEAVLTAGAMGVFSGLKEAEWFLKRVGIRITYAKADGASVKTGDIVMRISGSAKRILAAERTLLNLLQRMSGVTTKTTVMRKKLPKGIALLGTRKTLWGLLDKRAIALGGGWTHRLNLADAILIKDNHLHLEGDMKKGLMSVLHHAHRGRFVEIELDSPAMVKHFLNLSEEIKSLLSVFPKMVVMLDNLTPAAVGQYAPLLKKAGFFVEVSGGINENNIHRYAVLGVGAISSGALTGKADNLDISLHFS